jgi:UDP-N-acetylglucosamine--N-acetylmuramyl-(pentapeptide) pyrophosphoryl-undecaprenol N-acetylglucosamine transferase
VRPIVIAAGGTGGHFFPAEALADEFLSRGQRVALMTDARSAGMQSATFAGCERFVLAGAGVAGRGLKAIGAAAGLARGVLQARAILARLNAGAVVGFGGYPCVAPILAARGMGARRPKLVLHEQNAVLGRANRFLARRADLLALSFAVTDRVPAGTTRAVVGNPVRRAFFARPYAEPAGSFRLLVLGGSLGARIFSEVVPQALARLPRIVRDALHVTQQCRAEDLTGVEQAYADAGIAADLGRFFPDVADRLADAHLVIARAGASTVAELAVVGRPSILVPLPHAIDDHQSANARALADAGGACVIPQAEFTSQRLLELLLQTMNEPEHLAEAAEAARAVAQPFASAQLADAVETLVAETVP